MFSMNRSRLQKPRPLVTLSWRFGTRHSQVPAARRVVFADEAAVGALSPQLETVHRAKDLQGLVLNNLDRREVGLQRGDLPGLRGARALERCPVLGRPEAQGGRCRAVR